MFKKKVERSLFCTFEINFLMLGLNCWWGNRLEIEEMKNKLMLQKNSLKKYSTDLFLKPTYLPTTTWKSTTKASLILTN
jgi:hypothetical protein